MPRRNHNLKLLSINLFRVQVVIVELNFHKSNRLRRGTAE
jgi:hypothetical protein